MHFLVKFAIVVACYAMFHVYILQPFTAGGVCTSQARLEGKTVIVTGSNTGIGKATALDLAKRGARVIMACRNLTKANVALREIVEKTQNTNVLAKHLDLASLRSVRAFAEDINSNEPRLDVLINNAGVGGIQNLTKTEDGFEIIMGVNHLGHFLLTNLLLDLIKRSAPSRIVVVSSLAHLVATKNGLNFDNMNGELSYDHFDAYGQSKLANILITRELARRLQGTGVTANSLHPGFILTEINRNLPIRWKLLLSMISFLSKTQEQGAQTSIHLAVSEELEGVSGLYFADCKEKIPSETAQDAEVARKLWKVSEKLVGLETSD